MNGLATAVTELEPLIARPNPMTTSRMTQVISTKAAWEERFSAVYCPA
ncbi:MAG: hypothetical protein HGB26_04935 [Desulfobulbaceae bacterium]|nr:hypothetical protein [Desulfobulbaceae bacterium]